MHPDVRSGAVTINIISSTRTTSTNGVTFISLIGALLPRFLEKLLLKLIAIFILQHQSSREIIDANSVEKSSTRFDILFKSAENLL